MAKITERFDPPKDWDFEDMLDNYGNDFLIEKEYGDELFEMEFINEIMALNNTFTISNVSLEITLEDATFVTPIKKDKIILFYGNYF